jgi:hypothetical protein
MNRGTVRILAPDYGVDTSLPPAELEYLKSQIGDRRLHPDKSGLSPRPSCP